MEPDDFLSIELTSLADVIVLELRGEIDRFTAPKLLEILQNARGMGMPILLDMEHVSFMDSAGLSALISASGVAGGAPCSIRITRPSNQVHQVLSLTRLDTTLLHDA